MSHNAKTIEDNGNTGGGIKWLLLWLLMALISAATFYLFDTNVKPAKEPVTEKTVKANH
jgi:hypothetical protein